MAYEMKPGQFSLFKNEKKEKETQPDYTGNGMDTNGTECWISAWVKRPDGKKPFFSISIKPKDEQKSEAVKAAEVLVETVPDDLPF